MQAHLQGKRHQSALLESDEPGPALQEQQKQPEAEQELPAKGLNPHAPPWRSSREVSGADSWKSSKGVDAARLWKNGRDLDAASSWKSSGILSGTAYILITCSMRNKILSPMIKRATILI